MSRDDDNSLSTRRITDGIHHQLLTLEVKFGGWLINDEQGLGLALAGRCQTLKCRRGRGRRHHTYAAVANRRLLETYAKGGLSGDTAEQGTRHRARDRERNDQQYYTRGSAPPPQATQRETHGPPESQWNR